MSNGVFTEYHTICHTEIVIMTRDPASRLVICETGDISYIPHMGPLLKFIRL